MRGLHIEISKFGQGLRAPAIPNRRRVQFSSYEHRRLPKSFSNRAPGLRDIRTGARSRLQVEDAADLKVNENEHYGSGVELNHLQLLTNLVSLVAVLLIYRPP